MIKSLFLFCLPMVASHAFFNGNPQGPALIEEGFIFSKDQPFKFELGYQKDFVFDMKLGAKNLVDSTFQNSAALYDLAALRLDVWDHYQVYGLVGGVKCYFAQTLRSDNVVHYTSDSSFTFGVGGKILIYQGGGFSLGVDGQYRYASLDFPTIEKEGEYIPQKTAKASFYGFQFGLAASYQIDFLTPYIGITYLYQNVHFQKIQAHIVSNGDARFHATSRIPFGGLIGVSLSSSKDFALTIESRFVDENALTFSFDFKF
jgi:hypothetical protein